ncbi:MAG: thymidine phosphorylase [Pseudobdellovibrionaceae bacterium]
MDSFLAVEIIKKKRDGHVLFREEIQFMISHYSSGKLPDYQMSAFLMAVYFQGMNEHETAILTQCMLQSGIVVHLPNIKKFKVDKHSTGGVGDKTSLILGPIVAAAGIPVPMISGRGLGHTGGTLDKLESIPGFNTQLSLIEFERTLEKIDICFIGQTKEICPADKKIYALRDVTATIESLPLICASIMSKKLAEGIDGLVLDVKYGAGAFMKTPEEARVLAKKLMAIGKTYGKKVAAVLSQMDHPLGRFAGNSLEVFECLEIMRGKSFIGPQGKDLYADTRDLSLELSAIMIFLSDKTKSVEEGRKLAESLLVSGAALKKFEELVLAHDGRLGELPLSKNQQPVLSPESGFIEYMDTEKIGIVGILLGAGRAIVTDTIEPTAGIEFHVKIGDPIKKGDILFTLHGNRPELFKEATEKLLRTVRFSLQKLAAPPLIQERLLN